MADSEQKPVHTLILDAAPLLSNTPPLSSLLSKSHTLVTTPSVIKEIRDVATRSRVETLYTPFLVLRTPWPQSLKFVSEFARKTGDKSVLSSADLEILALAYEIECERNGGDWRLRSVPGQRGLNGRRPTEKARGMADELKERSDLRGLGGQEVESDTRSTGPQAEIQETGENPKAEAEHQVQDPVAAPQELAGQIERVQFVDSGIDENGIPEQPFPNQQLSPPEENPDPGLQGHPSTPPAKLSEDSSSESVSDGWITPSNIKKRQALKQSTALSGKEEGVMQVATITTDFAMQNVLLQINLNILSYNTLKRIRHLRAYILRCHACFYTTKEMAKQFCPRCGKPTLQRVSYSTNAKGEFKIHLKRNYQWNTRGDRYSIPKPVQGSASGKVNNGGGKGGWGNNLILAEDQKEYVRALKGSEKDRRRERDLMDDDHLPGLLTGERSRGVGRVQVGAGRNVNSKKR